MRGSVQTTKLERKRLDKGLSWSLVVAANSSAVLEGNLLRGEEALSAEEVRIHWNGESASRAFNEELERCTGDIVVFAHQDVFLPPGWAAQVTSAALSLFRQDPKWGVAGCYGITAAGVGVGQVFSSGLGRMVGKRALRPVPVETLDEVVIVLNRAAGIRFDESLPGFHLYGTDICLEAKQKGYFSYVIPLFVVHNSRGLQWLPLSFWRAYFYLRRKWRKRLPIVSPCTRITVSGLPILEDVLRSMWGSMFGRQKPQARVADPARLYEDVVKPNLE